MPTMRGDLARIPVYKPGRPVDGVARGLGIADVVKLASNENPLPPFPEVQAAIGAAAGATNRYPDTTSHHLVLAVAEYHGVEPERIWVGAGSTQLIVCIALAACEPGTSTVFAEPSFVMYPIATLLAGAEPVTAPLDADHRHDLDAMLAAVRDDTRIVFVCNPNNPTGTHVPARSIVALVDRLPDDVLVVVDEAYVDYVSSGDQASALPLATERDNVVVLRTFSKVYGLAGLRVGYAVGDPATLAMFLPAQPPFSVTSLGQVAAREALRHVDRLAQRVKDNDVGRNWLVSELAERGVSVVPSEANFVWVLPGSDVADLADRLIQRGVIVRPIGDGLRVSVGTVAENERFIAAWDEVR